MDRTDSVRDLSNPLRSAVRGSNQSGLRAHNERMVLTLVREHGPLAKAEIARSSGLSAQTISNIMRRLEDDGLIRRGDPVRGRIGQPSIPMTLDPEGAIGLGLKVGRRSLDAVAIDFMGQTIGRRRQTHSFPEPDATVEFAVAAAASLVEALPPRLRVRVSGLGIAMPFMLWDWAGSIGLPADKMASWRHRAIADEIAGATGLETFLRNDASSACGAELLFGRGGLPDDFLYFYVGYFIGGGLVLDRKLVVGRSGNAAAVGSLLVPDGNGGMRQLIDVASLARLERHLAEAGLPADRLWQTPEVWSLPDGIREKWLDEAAAGIAGAIAAADSVVEIEAALIDGWMPVEVRDELLARTRSCLAALDQTGVSVPAVLPGSVGPDARTLGAASLPLSEKFLVDPGMFRA